MNWRFQSKHKPACWIAQSMKPAFDHTMFQIIKSPTLIQADGAPPKTIEEFIGRVTSGTTALSVARIMKPLLQRLRCRYLLR